MIIMILLMSFNRATIKISCIPGPVGEMRQKQEERESRTFPPQSSNNCVSRWCTFPFISICFYLGKEYSGPCTVITVVSGVCFSHLSIHRWQTRIHKSFSEPSLFGTNNVLLFIIWQQVDKSLPNISIWAEYSPETYMFHKCIFQKLSLITGFLVGSINVSLFTKPN